MKAVTTYFTVVHPRDIVPESRHRAGLPPELTDGVDERSSLPYPRVLLIELRPDGVFLVRYGEGSVFAGDTWHQTVGEAKEQAEEEYGLALGSWQPVPSDEADPVRFALSHIS